MFKEKIAINVDRSSFRAPWQNGPWSVLVRQVLFIYKQERMVTPRYKEAFEAFDCDGLSMNPSTIGSSYTYTANVVAFPLSTLINVVLSRATSSWENRTYTVRLVPASTIASRSCGVPQVNVWLSDERHLAPTCSFNIQDTGRKFIFRKVCINIF